MPPRKPKQPARKKTAPRKGVAKKATQTKKSTSTRTPDGVEYNPQTHILCDDGKIYERKVVSGTGVAAGVNQTQKTDAHLQLEAKMTHAIHQAHSEGITDQEELRRRIIQAREDHLDGK